MPFTILGYRPMTIFSTLSSFCSFRPSLSQAFFGLPLLHFSWGFQDKANLVMLLCDLHRISLYLHLLCIISSSIGWLSPCWSLNSNMAIINTLIKCSIPLALSYPSNSYPAVLTILTMLSSRSHHAIITIFGMLY